MPWHIGKSKECPASKPFAVVKDNDGKVQGCHATRESAKKQLAALYASEERFMGKIEELWEKVKAVFEPELERASATAGWEGAASSYGSTEAYCSACAIDVNPSGEKKKQAYCMLPYKKGGKASKAGVVAAATRFNQVKKPAGVSSSTWSSAVAGAKRKLASAYRQFGMEVPDVLKSSRLRLKVRSQEYIERQDDGMTRLFSISSVSAVNRVGEIDSTKLFDSFIENWRATGENPQRDFMHLGHVNEHMITGDVDFMMRDGNVFITSTLYRDTPLAEAEIKFRMDNPGYWGDSIAYYGDNPEIIDVDGDQVAVFNSGMLRFVSTVPEHLAASLFTQGNLQIEEVDRMWDNLSDAAKDELINLLGEEKAKSMWAEQVDPVNRQIEEEGLVTRTTEEAEPESEPEPEAEVEYVEQVVELDEDAIAEVARQITEMDSIKDMFAPLMERISQLEETLQALSDELKERDKAEGVLRDKVAELERGEEEKFIEMMDDFPRKGKVRVAYRPKENANDEVDESTDDRAEAALASWGDDGFYNS